ncbi:MAG: universal stress protein, partial [Desulfomonilaceae bacterium]
MGTHGWTGFKHLILGSTAENVVRTAVCPVLTVRSSNGRARGDAQPS